ncbi:DNRLRE domain-containing protein [Micromonospora sp. DT228]|uniref:DNRLRE domain-containing protein n=1 Tax=Micromonospora sp. DT228 TaxID=3393443 RepID=UPI003CF60089
MTAPRLLSPFVRTRTRLTLTVGLTLAALVAAPLPGWLGSDEAPKDATIAARVAPRNEAAAAAEAHRTRTEVLVDTATTATARTWALPTGQLRSEFHVLPQRSQDAGGRWRDIDNTLTRTGKAPGGLDIRPVNVPAPVRFSNGGTTTDDSVLAEVDVAGHTIAYTWPGRLPEPVLDGARALYPEVRPGIDLLVVARDQGGFAQLLIVKDRAAAQSLGGVSYGLRSSTLVFHHDKNTGGVRVLDRAGGAEITSIPTPFAWDSAGRDPEAEPGAVARTSVANPADVLKLSGLSGSEPGAHHAPLSTRLDRDRTGDVRLHLDAAAGGLLGRPDTLFPVFIDPTLNSGETAWATVYAQNPNTNTWNGTNFNSGTTVTRVGYEKDSPFRARSFWRMGFSSSLRGATVSTASFKIFNNYSYSCTARELQLWLTGAISSGTTWNKQPGWIGEQSRQTFARGYNGNCAQDYVSFNATNAAQLGANSGVPNLTLGMRATNESDTNTWRKFSVNTALLSVTYNRPPNEPTDGTTTPGGACSTAGVTIAKTNIVLAANASDADGNLKGLRFRWWRSGETIPAGTLVTNLSGGRASLTIPTTSLVDGGLYFWDVNAQDESNATSSYFPPGNDPCRFVIDASAPPAPTVTSPVFREATPDGATWATVKFGQTGPVTFTAAGAVRFAYLYEDVGLVQYVNATNGTATVPNLMPRHAGPITLQVYAYDAVGNQSARTDYVSYIPPRDVADGPGDTGGDGIVDLLVVDSGGILRNYAGDVGGEIGGSQVASYDDRGTLNPAGHWFNPASGRAALITKYADAYPGDGSTDLFAINPDGTFWLYPGDGYGSFNVDKRLRVILPGNAPASSTWTQIKAVGDITGDRLPDLILRAGTSWWVLSGYTGASFQEATLMEDSTWTRQEIVNVADVDLDGTPDLVWRNLDSGIMFLRHGKPGGAPGSVALDSLKTPGGSRSGDIVYALGWTDTAITALIGIPDINGDRVPDFWARYGSGGMWTYRANTINAGMPFIVLGDGVNADKTFG